MFCKNCGADVGNNKFCANCGTAVVETAPSANAFNGYSSYYPQICEYERKAISIFTFGILKPKANKNGTETLVSYEDTPCFKLELVNDARVTLKYEHFTTVVVKENGGVLLCAGEKHCLVRGDRFFIPADIEFTLEGACAIICSPPKTEV